MLGNDSEGNESFSRETCDWMHTCPLMGEGVWMCDIVHAKGNFWLVFFPTQLPVFDQDSVVHT